jgi:hypothetical protein
MNHRGILLIVDMKDVAVGVLEPGGLEPPGDMNIAIAPEPWSFIVLERHTGYLNSSHD